jgi:hypothetical protein
MQVLIISLICLLLAVITTVHAERYSRKTKEDITKIFVLAFMSGLFFAMFFLLALLYIKYS